MFSAHTELLHFKQIHVTPKICCHDQFSLYIMESVPHYKRQSASACSNTTHMHMFRLCTLNKTNVAGKNGKQYK